MANMQSMYNDNYYVSPRTGANSDDFNFISGDISRGFLGVIYRFETNKFYLYPKLAIGTTAFYTDWGKADLKEKNSNIECTVEYSTKKTPHDHFTLAPSVSLGYKLSKRFYLNADIMFSRYSTNIQFKKEFTNLYTNKSSAEYFNYKKSISTLHLGAGLIFVI